MRTRTILISALILLTGRIINAQEYKIPVEDPKEARLQLDSFSGNLTVEGYGGNEIVITLADPIEPPARAKGLKPVYPGGRTDNTGMGLSVQKNGNSVSISYLLPYTQQREFVLKVPEEIALIISSGCENSGDLYISKMKNEIEVQNCYSLNLQQVSGPLVLNTISGDINITFGAMNTQKPFSINNVTGEIDITLPSNFAADIEMETMTGSMYSDFDFRNEDKDMMRVGGGRLTSRLNGGGTKCTITSVSGNIYLRKGE